MSKRNERWEADLAAAVKVERDAAAQEIARLTAEVRQFERRETLFLTELAEARRRLDELAAAALKVWSYRPNEQRPEAVRAWVDLRMLAEARASLPAKPSGGEP